MKMPPLKLRRWSRVEYDRMIATGVFDDKDRIELLDGLMVVKEPEGSWHAATVAHVQRVLQRAFGDRYHVRAHAPIALDEMSEPEPDLAVVRGKPRDFLQEHPDKPVLLVEVADSSLAKDRLRKSGLYARAGIAEYWIVNAIELVLEISRDPVRAPGLRYSWKYETVRLLRRGAIVSPLAAPRARIRISDLLP